MLQQVSLNQTTRKKILTRGDLVSELEKIMLDLRDREQFASIRSRSLDDFFPTDNPFLKQTTLGALATNVSEVLRDTSLVERKEIAALVEALHLVSVRSDYSLSLLNESFGRIERGAESVQQALQGIAAIVPKHVNAHRVPPEDANVAKLRKALSSLRKSEAFEGIKQKSIESFWDPAASTCSHLAKMTWSQIIETPASAIFDLPNFGKSRFKHLLASIERARTALDCKSSSPIVIELKDSENSIEVASKAVLSGISEIRALSTNKSENFSEVLTLSNSQALLTAYLSQSTIQRRVGQLLGVTESRISQLLQESERNIIDNFSKLEPALLHRIETRLSMPACSEIALLRELGLSQTPKEALDLIRVVISSLGAHHPSFKNKILKTHWSKTSGKFEDIMLKMIEQLPLSTGELTSRIEIELPNSSPPEILEAFSCASYYLKSRDFWYRNQEQALFEVLKNSKEPLTSQEITDIFETGPRQMRYLLQNSKNIVRIGRNNGRRYTIAAT